MMSQRTVIGIYPDRAGSQYNNRNSGCFDWLRGAQQFVIGRRFLFARLSFNLK